jgi:hypothetical protein
MASCSDGGMWQVRLRSPGRVVHEIVHVASLIVQFRARPERGVCWGRLALAELLGLRAAILGRTSRRWGYHLVEGTIGASLVLRMAGIWRCPSGMEQAGQTLRDVNFRLCCPWA